VPSKRALSLRDSSCKGVSEMRHAIIGTRVGPVGGKDNTETGGAVLGSGADVD
jgi:hypothetical protein